PQDKGRYILEYVCKQLNILEMDYFGLRYVDKERERTFSIFENNVFVDNFIIRIM
ncbi:ferm domain-containing protein 5-like protein, partial [Lasius niger]